MKICLYIASLVATATLCMEKQPEQQRVPYIDLSKSSNYGIRALFDFSPEIAKPFWELVNTVMRKNTPALPPTVREYIAAHVSLLNQCDFCYKSHTAIMKSSYYNDLELLVLPNSFNALLHIADKVQLSGRAVARAQIDDAKKYGATDDDIHDTVLIASLFCMCNRYVDGLNAPLPPAIEDPSYYQLNATRIAQHGYLPLSDK